MFHDGCSYVNLSNNSSSAMYIGFIYRKETEIKLLIVFPSLRRSALMDEGIGDL